MQADLTTAGAVEKLFADAISAVGRPDIAINTVGKVLKKPDIPNSKAGRAMIIVAQHAHTDPDRKRF
ncbi:hypothetical protein TU73_11650 [Pseudomonas libanensis]|uniref:Uncharacterized protein n=1 Tax=Pseudomonas libanensis TaxID=75588 RepID=A0A0R2YBS7_9PSED|nr:hypothetical protein TU73_11650 [Pseudomonas libanensis]